LTPAANAKGFLRYVLDGGGSTNVNYAGIAYSGTFGAGLLPGKVVVMGIPFETIVPAASRIELMSRILYANPSTAITLPEKTAAFQILSTDKGIKIIAEQALTVAIYRSDGILVSPAKDILNHEYALQRGLYLVKINEKVVKIVR
jgi:hypothetical protein